MTNIIALHQGKTSDYAGTGMIHTCSVKLVIFLLKSKQEPPVAGRYIMNLYNHPGDNIKIGNEDFPLDTRSGKLIFSMGILF